MTDRQALFSPAYELCKLELLPPFHTCWSDITARRDECARALSTAGRLILPQILGALENVGGNWDVGPDAFRILSSWYGEHFSRATAFLPQIQVLEPGANDPADPPGHREGKCLADQWGRHLGVGTAGRARRCYSALGLIGVGDGTMVYGVDVRDQLVIVLTYGDVDEKTLDRVRR